MEFLKHAKEVEALLKGKILILYHGDADGITSTALFKKFFKAESMFIDAPRLSRDEVREIMGKKPDILLVLDLAIEQDFENIKKLEKGMRIVILDHHLFEKDLNSGKTLYLNPLAEKDVYMPTACLSYKLLKEMGKPVEREAWIAGIGIIADYGMKDCQDVLEEVEGRWPGLTKGGFKSPLSLGGKLITSAITVSGASGGGKALGYLLKAKSFDDFKNKRQLVDWNDDVESEIRNVVDSFRGERKLYPDKNLAVFNLKSKYSISSSVATILSIRNPDLVLIIRRKTPDGVKLSMRNQSGRVDLNAIARKAARGIGSAGGHKRAAGGFVTDWDLFLKRFLKEL